MKHLKIKTGLEKTQIISAYNRSLGYIDSPYGYVFPPEDPGQDPQTEQGQEVPYEALEKLLHEALASPRLSPQAAWELCHIYGVAIEVYDLYEERS